MPRRAYVFVRTDMKVEAFVDLLHNLKGIGFTRRKDAREYWYEANVGNCLITVGYHNLENDRGVRFEDYPISIEVLRRRIDSQTGWQDPAMDIAKDIFLWLQQPEETDISMMLMDDLDVKVASYRGP